MPNGGQLAAGKNPEELATIKRKAYALRKKGMSLGAIGRVLAPLRRGRWEGKPYDPSTIHTWVKIALRADYPADAALVGDLRSMEDARIEKLLLALDPQLRNHSPCQACGRADREVSPSAVGEARQLSKRRSALHGLDAPKELAVYDASLIQLQSYSDLVKRVLYRDWPSADADALAYAIEVEACLVDGVAPPADVEVKAIKVIEGKVG